MSTDNTLEYRCENHLCRVAGNTVWSIDKWSHQRIRVLLTYMCYTNRRILYFTVQLAWLGLGGVRSSVSGVR